jgi:hypothetical protein
MAVSDGTQNLPSLTDEDVMFMPENILPETLVGKDAYSDYQHFGLRDTYATPHGLVGQIYSDLSYTSFYVLFTLQCK